jgi:hypothetical protein
LWAGTPLLTILGDKLSSRVAGSLLNAVGCPELVCDSLSEYEEKAVMYGLEKQSLEAVRAKVRANRLTTPLFDTRLWSYHFGVSIKEMFRLYYFPSGEAIKKHSAPAASANKVDVDTEPDTEPDIKPVCTFVNRRPQLGGDKMQFGPIDVKRILEGQGVDTISIPGSK